MRSLSSCILSTTDWRTCISGLPPNSLFNNSDAWVNSLSENGLSRCTTRFCTSRSLSTKITKIRNSSKRKNSICRRLTWLRRGVVIRQVICVNWDNTSDAALTNSDEDISGFNSASISLVRASCQGSTLSNVSTKNRKPSCVGIFPAEVCGELTNPRASRSPITLRTVAEETCTSGNIAKALEATGVPSAM